jgi:hypothetical protein
MKRHPKLNLRQPAVEPLVRVSGFDRYMMHIIFDVFETTVACRAVAMQRPRDGRMHQSPLWVTPR